MHLSGCMAWCAVPRHAAMRTTLSRASDAETILYMPSVGFDSQRARWCALCVVSVVHRNKRELPRTGRTPTVPLTSGLKLVTVCTQNALVAGRPAAVVSGRRF